MKNSFIKFSTQNNKDMHAVRNVEKHSYSIFLTHAYFKFFLCLHFINIWHGQFENTVIAKFSKLSPYILLHVLIYTYLHIHA